MRARWGTSGGVAVVATAVALLAAGGPGGGAPPHARPTPARLAASAHATGAGIGARAPGAGIGARAVGARALGAGDAVPVAAAPTADGGGFWVASTDGAVTSEGDATGHGDGTGLALAAPVVGIAATPGGAGYWLLGADGGVFSYGDAAFHGSTGGLRLNQPALQLVGTPTAGGYWFVARDGGVFAFGDAPFEGSMGSQHLNQPVVGMATTSTGRGYWLAARDGGVFAFGDAPFEGSMGGQHLNQPVVAVAGTRSGRGYWMVARDGGVFAFGDAAFHGSAAGSRHAAAVGLVATGDGGGYWMVLADGSVLPFGDAAATGAPIPSDGWSMVGEVVTVDPGHDGGNAADPAAIDALVPSGPGQLKACDTVGTSTDDGYPEHAFTWDVANRLAAVLRNRGAEVVLTRSSDTGVGPCVDQRAAIGNQAGSDAAISIHGDGAPPGDRGFAVLLPATFPGYNDAVAAASAGLGATVRDALAAGTPLPISTYDGVDGLAVRDDLGGLNLSTVPKVLVELGNMRDATDASLEEDPAVRQQAAVALADGLSTWLVGGA